jgi:hypothetical protein
MLYAYVRKIDMMKREWKNLEIGSNLNQALYDDDLVLVERHGAKMGG